MKKSLKYFWTAALIFYSLRIITNSTTLIEHIIPIAFVIHISVLSIKNKQ